MPLHHLHKHHYFILKNNASTLGSVETAGTCVLLTKWPMTVLIGSGPSFAVYCGGQESHLVAVSCFHFLLIYLLVFSSPRNKVKAS